MIHKLPKYLRLPAAVLALCHVTNALEVTDMPALPVPAGDYSFAYWLNGWRNGPGNALPDILCFETSYYGFALDMGDLGRARFGLLERDVDYVGALESGVARLGPLSAAALAIELEVGGTLYRATTCKAGTEKDLKHLRYARIWESGRLVQHVDLLGLVFVDSDGNPLGCDGVLDIHVWPKSLTFTVDLSPSLIYRNGAVPGISGNGLCVIDQPLDIAHSSAMDPENLTLECWVQIPETLADGNAGWLICKNGNEWEEGNYGFLLQRDRVSATLNIGGGRQNQCTLGQTMGLFQRDTWHHLALSYDGATMRFHLDGQLQGETSIGKPRVPGKGLMRVGMRADGHGRPVRALFDQIRVWNRALPQEEIADHAVNPQNLAVNTGLTFEENLDPDAHGEPVVPPHWENARVSIRFHSDAGDWHGTKQVPGVWESGSRQQVSLTCVPGTPEASPATVPIRVDSLEGQVFPVAFDEARNCYVAHVEGLKREWQTGYTDIRDYDEFAITVEATAAGSAYVPFLLDFVGVANPTGLCPILCDQNGVPTGIPVQLSKNWHYEKIGSYLRAYMLLPAAAVKTTYRLRVVYGFYGTLPSASHAQLSLVGYGGNGRWDQLAIGCWGETFCLDMDMSCVDVAITDVRMLMARNGLDGKKWHWTDAGWGGDWLCVKESERGKLTFSQMKTAYLAHGPCLTEVRYDGSYGSKRQVALKATVRTLRTDDYARTFHRLEYTFGQDLPVGDGWLFKMGSTGSLVTPQIAYGHRDGLIAKHDLPLNLKSGELFVDRVTLAGEGPWWIAFPGALDISGRDWGTGSRALVVRSYQASFGGQFAHQPTISMPVHSVQQDGRLDLDLLLVPPEGVDTFAPGDTVSLDAEWITVPRIAVDYYGPNEAFRQHMEDHPASWETVYREAKGNDLEVAVTGGRVLSAYPIIVQVEGPEVTVEIEGGVGMVPLRFEGLPSATGYAVYRAVEGRLVELDQSVHGNDFWQTDFDAGTRSYRISFNLPLDGLDVSTWVLKHL